MAVYKRNNVWYIDYYIKVNGKRERRRESVSTRRDVAEARLKKYHEMVKARKDPVEVNSKELSYNPQEKNSQENINNVPQDLTLAQFVPIFLELHGKFLSTKMQESYKTSFGHLIPVFGNNCLNSMSKVSVQTYMVTRKKEGACNTTVNKEIRCLTKTLSMATEWGYIKENPLKGLKILREPPERIRYLTKKEYKHLLAESPLYLRDIIVFAVGTGIRKSEIFNLTWNDIKFSETSKYGMITVLGKGDKRRYLSMNKTVYDLLIRLYREKEGNYVFTSQITGGKITDVKKAFSTALKKSCIEDFRFHDLRHTFASWLVMSGVDLYTVQRLLGHTNIRTTMRYAHLAPNFLEQEIGKIDEILSSDISASDASSVSIKSVAL